MQYCFEEVKKQLTNFKRAYATAACRYVRRHAYSCWKNATPDSDLYQQDIGGGLLAPITHVSTQEQPRQLSGKLG